MSETMVETRGLFMVFTGNGKGKTTSAIGMAMRAAGHGMKVFFIQFIKGDWKYGEMGAFERFSDTIDFHVIGNGFTWKSENLEKDKEIARSAWEKTKEAIFSDEYQMVILDEFTYLLLYGMVDRKETLAVFKDKPEHLHLVVTGRNAGRELCDLADLVTEMQQVKHPYELGVVGQKGVEY